MRPLTCICLLCLALASCRTVRTVHVPVETVRTARDTVRIISLRTDTVMRLDSVSLMQRGDTIMLEHRRIDLRVRTLRDTVRLATHDTARIREPYPVETVREVPRPLTRWQQVRIHAGEAAMLAAIALLAWLMLRKRLHKP